MNSEKRGNWLMNPVLMSRVNNTWIEHFNLVPESVDQLGTTIYKNETWDDDSYVILWPVGQHIVVEVSSIVESAVRDVLLQFPAQHRLSLNDFKNAWGDVETSGMPMYVLDETVFQSATVSDPYVLRQLTTADQAAFDAFLAQCSEDGRDEGTWVIDHMIAFGVFDGPRITAVGSVFIWRGFIDIGILTDPAYRQKGFGKALVSACATRYLADSKVVCYRHDIVNVGSRGIAKSLNFRWCADVDMLKPPMEYRKDHS